MRRPVAAWLAAGLLAFSACGGGAAAPTTSSTAAVEDLRRAIAAEYAESAERALVDTRYDALGPEGIMDLVLDACDRLVAATPDAAVAGAIIALGLDEAGEPVDERIVVEVISEGMATACPNDVLRASGIDPAAPVETDLDVLFLGAVAPFADSAGFSFPDDELIAAGEAVCAVLEDGRDPEAAILEGLGVLFDISAGSLEEAGEAAQEEGLLLGAVLGAASVYYCPSHAERVAVYIQEGGFG